MASPGLVRLVWGFVGFFAAFAPAATAAPVPDYPHVPGRLIVGFQDTVTPFARRGVHAAVGVVEVRALVHPRMDLAIFDANENLAAREAAYRARPEVDFVHPDYLGGGGFVPNDTFYGDQWHLSNTGQSGGTAGADIEAEAGWDIAAGGASVVVAVLDTGIDSDHQEFAGRIVAGWDFVNDDPDAEDDHGHGSLVAGLLAANTGNGFGVAGVDHSCVILPIKVLDEFNAGSTSSLINGLGFAAANDADVINLSLVNYPCTAGLLDALSEAELAGAILVACAGNGGIGDADSWCPGASDHTISVGTTTDLDARAFYSSTGSALDFVAPGHLLQSVLYDSLDDGSTTFSGCSAATPVAAGIVSILRALAPELRADGVRAILQASAEDLVGAPEEDTPGWDEFMGYGRLNLRHALEHFLQATAAKRLAATDDLLLEATPNPSVGAATVRFSLPAASWVTLTIHDVHGRTVRTIVQGIAAPGRHEVRWDGRDRDGHSVAPSVYFARLVTSGQTTQQKITLLR